MYLPRATPALLAARAGHGVAVISLLERKRDGASDPCPYTMHIFIRGGQEETRDRWRGTNYDNSMATPLHLAVREDDVRLVREVLKQNPDAVNAVDYEVMTPLHWALRNNYPIRAPARDNGVLKEILGLLVDNGADVNAAQCNGWTPLHFAAYAFHAETGETATRFLLDNGADVNASGFRGWTPLHFAAWLRRETTSRLLLESGADDKAETVERHRATPLQLAQNVSSCRCSRIA